MKRCEGTCNVAVTFLFKEKYSSHRNGYFATSSCTWSFSRNLCHNTRNRFLDKAWRKVSGWTTGVPFLAGAGIFFLSPRPDRLWCPPSLPCNGRGVPDTLKAEREADHSPSSSAEVNAWSYPPFFHTSSWRCD